MDAQLKDLLSLYDNQYGEYRTDITQECNEKQIALLRKYSGCSIKELQERGIQTLGMNQAYKDEVAKDYWVYRLVEKEGKVFLETGNAMGVLRFQDVDSGEDINLQIKSRFDTGESQFFLVYMLSKVFGGIFLKDMDIPAEGPDMWDFLIALIFRKQVKNACKIGLYREYRINHHNDLRYRGKFDIDTQIKRNIPFLGKIAYTTRDISFDNSLNHLIRHALQKIKNKWPLLIADGHDFTGLIHLFEQNTPSWEKKDIWNCVHDRKNRVAVKHPLYAPYYEPLRILSRALLHEEGANPYSNSENELEGFLFDGAWLWEEYLNSILEPLGFKHPRNKEKKYPVQVFQKHAYQKREFYPDFYNKEAVLDAKYKRLDSQQIQIDDLCQIISYIHVLESKKGYFLYPRESSDIASTIKLQSIGALNGFGGEVFTIGLQIPVEAETVRTFTTGMEKQEKELEAVLMEK